MALTPDVPIVPNPLNTKKLLNDQSGLGNAAFPVSKRRVFARTSYCVVRYFHYRKQNFGTMSNFRDHNFEDVAFKVDTGVIQEEIRSVKISKTIAAPSGTFDIELHPTQNWKAKIAPGDWVMIYFFDHLENDKPNFSGSKSTKNMVMLANVDRVARTITKDEETDKTKLSYVMSGRGFGKAFEETDVWYDPYATQVAVADAALRKAGLEITGSPSEQVKQVVDVFLGPGSIFPTGATAPLLQWRIPTELAFAFGVTDFAVPGKPTIYDIINQEIDEVPGYKVRTMLNVESNGSVWDMVHRASNNLINEVFLEDKRSVTGQVTPTLVLRPRPLNTPFFEATAAADSQFGSEDAKLRPLLKYKTMQRLARTDFIEIEAGGVSPSEIRYENLGRDEHSRFNMFWIKTTLDYQYMHSTVSNVNQKASIANPVFVRESIHRHGLHRFDQTLEYCFSKSLHSQQEVQAASRNVDLYKAFMVQLYDLHYANHLYEAGTIETTGILEAELGKCLLLTAPEGDFDPKGYYIEGYEHHWKFPSTWTTTFTVTHGQFIVNKGLDIFIDVVSDPSDFGREDTNVDTTFLAKTTTRKS